MECLNRFAEYAIGSPGIELICKARERGVDQGRRASELIVRCLQHMENHVKEKGIDCPSDFQADCKVLSTQIRRPGAVIPFKRVFDLMALWEGCGSYELIAEYSIVLQAVSELPDGQVLGIITGLCRMVPDTLGWDFLSEVGWVVASFITHHGAQKGEIDVVRNAVLVITASLIKEDLDIEVADMVGLCKMMAALCQVGALSKELFDAIGRVATAIWTQYQADETEDAIAKCSAVELVASLVVGSRRPRMCNSVWLERALPLIEKGNFMTDYHRKLWILAFDILSQEPERADALQQPRARLLVDGIPHNEVLLNSQAREWFYTLQDARWVMPLDLVSLYRDPEGFVHST